MPARSKRQIGGALIAGLALAATPTAHAASGLAPFPVSRGCVSAHPIAPCKKGNGTAGGPIVLSPDGRFAYVASYVSNAITVFALHGGTVSQLPGPGGCIAGEGGRPGCLRDEELDEPNDIVLSPDGRFAYVANGDANAVDVFDRDPVTGKLSPAPGIPATKVAEPLGIVVSPDGRELYADSLASGRIAVLDRDPETGAVHLAEEVEGCIPGPDGCRKLIGSKIVISPDGDGVYATAVEDTRRGPADVVQAFSRNPVTGALAPIAGPQGCATNQKIRSCQTVSQLGDFALAISPDGKNLYVGAFSPGSIVTFDRDSSGALKASRGPALCVYRPYRAASCSASRIGTVEGLLVSPDGRKVYVTGQSLLMTLSRDPGDGTLRVAGALAHLGFHLGVELALSPNGQVLYDSVALPGGLRSFSLR